MALTKQQKRAKKLKKRKASGADNQPSKFNDKDPFAAIGNMLGISTGVGEKNEAFSSGRIKTEDRISYGRPEEKELLLKFKKTILEENFKRISDYSKLYADFEERFYKHDRSVDVNAVNIVLSQKEVLHYFTECQDTGMDLINNMCDLASYAKNKEYLELQKNIITAYNKTFKPRMVGICNRMVDKVESMDDIILNLRAVQSRYVEGAPHVASYEKIKIDTIRGRTKAFLKYAQEMFRASKQNIYASINKSIADSEDQSKKVNNARLDLMEMVGSDSEFAMTVKIGNVKEMLDQAALMINEFKELETKLSVIPKTMINSNEVLDYQLIKQSFKSSGLKLGSADDYLQIFKPMYSRMIAVINSLEEILYDSKEETYLSVANYISEKLATGDLKGKPYNPLMGAVERSVGKFILFCEEKDLSWNNETAIKKAAIKFNKSWTRKEYVRVQNEANNILEELLNEFLDSTDIGRMEQAYIATDQYVDNRDFLYTKSMLNIRHIIEDKKQNENEILKSLISNTILEFREEDIIQLFASIQYFIKEDTIKYDFYNGGFNITERENSEFKTRAIHNFAVLNEKWLLYINNTVSFYYFSKKVNFNKIVKAIDKKIISLFDFLNERLLTNKVDCKTYDTYGLLEFMATMIPDILIFSSRKGYQFNSVELAEKLNEKFTKEQSNLKLK